MWGDAARTVRGRGQSGPPVARAARGRSETTAGVPPLRRDVPATCSRSFSGASAFVDTSAFTGRRGDVDRLRR